MNHATAVRLTATRLRVLADFLPTLLKLSVSERALSLAEDALETAVSDYGVDLLSDRLELTRWDVLNSALCALRESSYVLSFFGYSEDEGDGEDDGAERLDRAEIEVVDQAYGAIEALMHAAGSKLFCDPRKQPRSRKRAGGAIEALIFCDLRKQPRSRKRAGGAK